MCLILHHKVMWCNVGNITIGRITMNSNTAIKRAIIQARAKDLTVRRNVFHGGWSVQLPNGCTYNAKTDVDLVEYVKGY